MPRPRCRTNAPIGHALAGFPLHARLQFKGSDGVTAPNSHDGKAAGLGRTDDQYGLFIGAVLALRVFVLSEAASA